MATGVAGAILVLLAASFWLVVLEIEAPVLALLAGVPLIAFAGPAYPASSGRALVVLGGLVSVLALGHAIVVDLTLAVPLVLAGLLLVTGSGRPGPTAGRGGLPS